MVVLDASVILKWLLPEEGSEVALRLRDQHLQGTEHIVVPSLLFYEVANVLRYKEELPEEELVSLFEILHDLELSAMHPAFPELEETMLYARQKDISVYDATYVTLAKRVGCEMKSADARLVNAVEEPFVKPLETAV